MLNSVIVMNRSTSKVVRIVFLVLVFLVFFNLNILIPVKRSLLDYPLLIAIVLLTIGHYNFKTQYSKTIIIYAIFVLISCLYSYFANEQTFFMVVGHSYKYLAILFFFYLTASKLTSKEAERVLLIISITCCCCYIIQWLIYPTILFQGAEGDKANISTSYYRVRIPGSITCYSLFLYGFNKFLMRNSIKYILYSALGLLPIIIQGFRTLTVLSLISFFLMIPFVKKSTSKTILYGLLGCVFSLAFLQIPIVQSKIAEMENRQKENQTFSNDDYIRIREFDYYWNEQFKNPVEKILGGGVPTDPKSKYDKDIHGVAYSKGLFWDDLGLVGLSMIIGIPAVMLLISMYSICIWKYKELNYQYLRFTLIIVLLGSFTTAELFREGNLLILSLYLYIEYKYHKEEKKLIFIKDNV